jgi:hypothetical protein
VRILARLKPLQRCFLKSLLSKLLFFPSVWCFVWAIYPLAWEENRQPIYYLMLSLYNWLCFIITLIGAVVIEMIIAHPELRRSLTHIERGKPKQQKIGEKGKERKKEKKLPLY